VLSLFGRPGERIHMHSASYPESPRSLQGQRTRFTRRMAPAPSTPHAPATAYSTP
jgi:hypothetical protein